MTLRPQKPTAQIEVEEGKNIVFGEGFPRGMVFPNFKAPSHHAQNSYKYIPNECIPTHEKCW